MMLIIPEYVVSCIFALLALPFICAAYVNWIKSKCVTSTTSDENSVEGINFPYKIYFRSSVILGVVYAIIISFPIYPENPHNLYCDPALVDGTARTFAIYSTWNGKACQVTVQTYYEAAFAFCALFLLLYSPL